MNHEATIQYLEQRLAQLSIENDGLKQELRRLKPQAVVNPKGKLVHLKQVGDEERMATVYYVNLVSKLPVFAHQNLAPWAKLLDYHRILEQNGKMDANITADHFNQKYIENEVFQKPTNGKKTQKPKVKAKPKNYALVGR